MAERNSKKAERNRVRSRPERIARKKDDDTRNTGAPDKAAKADEMEMKWPCLEHDGIRLVWRCSCTGQSAHG